MGLDMYLNKMPRYKNTTAKDISTLESYFQWKEKRKEGKYKGTLEKWCGVKYADAPKGDVRKFYEPFYATKYADWDVEKKYGWGRIMEEVGYWRKANEIHNWFVENVQDGEDDCRYHREVTKEILEELLDVCNTVLNSCQLVSGQIENGYNFDDNGNKVYNYIEGNVVADPSVAMKLLPTQSGFFFGGTSYDEWYVADVQSTIDIITKVLETTDFDKEMIYYVSSW